MYCHASHQISDHAHRMGLEQMEEIEQERRMLQSLRMGKKYITSTGRRHCRLKIKPLSIATEYLNGYAKQFARQKGFTK